MAIIGIPADTYAHAVATGAGRGSKQMAVLREYLADKIPQGHEVTGYMRDVDGLHAVTAPVRAKNPNVPDKFEKPPKRG